MDFSSPNRRFVETRWKPALSRRSWSGHQRQDYLRAVWERDGSFDGALCLRRQLHWNLLSSVVSGSKTGRRQDTPLPRPEAAEKAGFRQCLRCKPKLTSQRAELVGGVCAHIQSNLRGILDLTALGKEFSISPFHLQRVFKEVVGMSPRRYTEECRINRLKEHLGDGQIGHIRAAGSRLQLPELAVRRFDRKAGHDPRRLSKRRGGDADILSDRSSPLGRLLVAATEHGICMVSLGGSDAELAKALHKEYPKAVIVESKEAQGLFDDVLGYFRGQQKKRPLDMRGTAFQRKVWAVLQTIPDGQGRVVQRDRCRIGSRGP